MNFYEEQKRNAFKPSRENPILLDFTGCKYLREMHSILKVTFGLPEYYGENWDALWDCLNGLFIGEGDVTVIVRGLSTMPEEFAEDINIMLEIFADVHESTPNVTFTVCAP